MTGGQRMDTRIYVMTHKEYSEPAEKIYTSLAVGKALNTSLPYQGDDTGENISEKNRNYCELTGIYWIWKNITCDIVGICHYRRYFVRGKACLKQEQIESTLEDFDVIVARSECSMTANVREQYAIKHFVKDLDMCRQVLEEMHPEYLSVFDLFANCRLFTIGNMIITRKEIFDRYCEWLFPILFEVEKRTDISEYEPYQARLYGFLSERLMRVWLLAQPLKVKEEEVRLTDAKELEEQSKLYLLTKKYIGVAQQDLITLYRTGNYFDLEPIEPKAVDFGGRIPIWICAWNDDRTMSGAVRRRVNNIKKNIYSDIAVPIAIDFQNLWEYINLPAWIVDKYKRYSIPLGQMSDMAEMALLYSYGGVWLGMDCGAEDVNMEILKSEFYAKRSVATANSCVHGGCLDISVLRCKAGNVLARYVLNALYLYWYMKDEMIYDELTDAIIAVAYDNIDEIRKIIDEI
jgi:hypothetical protein